jgi:hypothetical protein
MNNLYSIKEFQMSKFIVLFSFLIMLTVMSCSSTPPTPLNTPNPSTTPNPTNTTNLSITPNTPNTAKNNDPEQIVYFHENPSAKDEIESISFLDSSIIIYSFIRGETLISTEKWVYLINKDKIFIDSMKYQATGTYSKGTYSNEKVVINGKEFTRHIEHAN